MMTHTVIDHEGIGFVIRDSEGGFVMEDGAILTFLEHHRAQAYCDALNAEGDYARSLPRSSS